MSSSEVFVNSPAPKVSQGLLAITLTLFAPGLGHLVAGQSRRAAIWFALFVAIQALGLILLCTPNLFLLLIPFFPLTVLFAIAACVSAYRSAMRSGRWRTNPLMQIIAAFLLLAALLFVSPANVCAKVGADFARNNFVEPFTISGGSMSPNLLPGDSLVAHKNQKLGRWDMVVFDDPRDPSRRVVSRIAGLPGERIRIVDGLLEVDGAVTQLPSGVGPYTQLNYFGMEVRNLARRPCAGCEENPIQLGPEEYFILGDNSEKALDSRLWEMPVDGHTRGALPSEFILGRVTAIYWPPSRWCRF